MRAERGSLPAGVEIASLAVVRSLATTGDLWDELRPALQAVAYQEAMVVLMFLTMGCYFCSFFGLFLFMPFASALNHFGGAESALAMLGFFSPFLVVIVFLLLQLVLVVYGIFGAVRALQGKDFEYVVIGQRVRRYLA